jgi:hypothetical protein
MGNLQAEAIIEAGVPLDTQIEFHLRANHYPPISNTMVPVCLEAIEWANMGEWHKNLSLPEGVGYKGLTIAPVHAIIEQHHLEPWIDEEQL